MRRPRERGSCAGWEVRERVEESVLRACVLSSRKRGSLRRASR